MQGSINGRDTDSGARIGMSSIHTKSTYELFRHADRLRSPRPCLSSSNLRYQLQHNVLSAYTCIQ